MIQINFFRIIRVVIYFVAGDDIPFGRTEAIPGPIGLFAVTELDDGEIPVAALRFLLLKAQQRPRSGSLAAADEAAELPAVIGPDDDKYDADESGR